MKKQSKIVMAVLVTVLLGACASTSQKQSVCKVPQKKEVKRCNPYQCGDIDQFVTENNLTPKKANHWLWFYVLNVHRGDDWIRVGYNLIVTTDEGKNRMCVKVVPKQQKRELFIRDHYTVCGSIRSVKVFEKRLLFIRGHFARNQEKHFHDLPHGLRWYWQNVRYHHRRGQEIVCEETPAPKCCIKGCTSGSCCRRVKKLEIRIFREIQRFFVTASRDNPFVKR